MTKVINNKRILFSLAAIVAVAAMVAGATGAFFSDTETSEGNIFTAGSIDLKVDHTKQTYNGVDCKTCDVTVLSDTSNMVVAKNGSPIATTSAVILSTINPNWTADVDGTANDAKWIWVTNPVAQEDTTVNTTYTFQKTFNWLGPITGATINFSVATDNSYEVYLNGVQIAVDTSENNFSSADTVVAVNVSNNIHQGNNILQFKVTNKAMTNGNPQSNPAGLLYKLVIDGNCQDTFFQNQCSLFSETDLDGSQQFFQFDDIKPGDYGTNVISLHVYDNDAYACLLATDGVDNENGVQESEQPDDATAGEVQNYINFFSWLDTNGDGEYDSGETSLGTSTLGDLGSIASLDPATNQWLTATTTAFIGMAWCAGDIVVNGNDISCDGDGMLNNAQSDSFTASLTAYAEQKRNNDGFRCSAVDLSKPPVSPSV